jgi:hypothetical protein
MYDIEDPIEACTNSLRDLGEVKDGISRRQIFEDIKFQKAKRLSSYAG